MKKNLFSFLFLLILIVNCFLHAQAFCVFKTPQGQTVIIEQMKGNPIVTIDTWIKTGSINENDENSGVSHFLEHLFFKGTNKYPTGMFDKILEAKGAINNAATSKDFTHYYITIPSKDFETAMELHADMLLNPLLPRKELEMERKVVLEEISRSKDTPERILYNNLISILYKVHPYHREVLGSSKVIETITREEILNYYNKFYIPANMVTVIVGDVEPDDVKQQINKYFVTKNKNKKPIVFYHNDKILSKQTQHIDKADVKSGYMLIGFRGVNNFNKKDSYALDVLAAIMGDGKTSRLYQNVKEKKQLAITVSAGHSTYKDDSIFSIRTTFIPQNFDALKKEIFTQIEKLSNETFSTQEIERAKKIIERDTYYSREAISNIANEIGYTTVIYGTPKFYESYISEINKVNAEDLKRVAKKYITSNKAAISIILPKDANLIPTSNIQKNDIKPLKEEKVGDITKYNLKNGATLLINDKTTNDIVAIKMYSVGGNYIEEKPGVASLTATTMMKGTKKYSAYELSEILEEKGIKIVPSSAADTFSISIKTTKKDLQNALSLLEEVLNNATFNSYETDKAKKDAISLIKQNRDNPFSVAVEEFKTKAWEGNPYGATGKVLEKSIPSISSNDIIKFYGNIFAPQNTVISVNGNVNHQELINYFSDVINNKKSSKIKFSDYKDKNTTLKEIKTLNIDKNTQTAWLVLGWQTAGNDNVKDWATLQVIDSLLGTGMSSRLFVNLRDEQGLAYQIGSFYISNINHGLFGVYIGTNPKNYNTAKKDIFKEIQNLKTQFVTDKELQEAKDKLLGHYLLSKETNMEKASNAGWYEASGRGFEFDDKFPKIIQNVTAEDIINTANKYFNNNYVITTVAKQSDLK